MILQRDQKYEIKLRKVMIMLQIIFYGFWVWALDVLGRDIENIYRYDEW